MNDPVSTRLIAIFTKISLILSILIGIIGVAVTLGWIFDVSLLISISLHKIVIKPNTAISFILISIALTLQHIKSDKNQHLWNSISITLAIIVSIIGLFTCLEYITGDNFHIDGFVLQLNASLLDGHPINRMAPITSVVFFMTGIVIILTANKIALRSAQILAFLIGLFGLVVISAYAYHQETLTPILYYLHAALYSAISFFFISIALLFLHPEQGLCRLFVSKTIGGRVARRLFPLALFMAPLLAYLQFLGLHLKLYDTDSGTVFLTLCISTIFCVIIFHVAYKLSRADNLRMHNEMTLNATLANLERSNTELQQFAYIASHDLQEPLRMVSSYTQLLARRYEDKLDQEGKEFIAFAVDGANRMQTLINDLLVYSRVTTKAQPLLPTDANAILKTALDNLQLSINECNANITHDPLPVINVDETQIIQVFQNLISNAIKFCDKNPKIHISAKLSNNMWIFSVKDNGIGIAPAFFEQIFIIFQRLHTREQYPGSGIGLTICKKIVERHGGKIWLESEPGIGSTFYFSIPQ